MGFGDEIPRRVLGRQPQASPHAQHKKQESGSEASPDSHPSHFKPPRSEERVQGTCSLLGLGAKPQSSPHAQHKKNKNQAAKRHLIPPPLRLNPFSKTFQLSVIAPHRGVFFCYSRFFRPCSLRIPLLPEDGNDYVAIKEFPRSSCTQKTVKSGRLDAFVNDKGGLPICLPERKRRLAPRC